MEEKTIITRQFKCAKPSAITLSSDGLIRIGRYVIGSWNKITEGELKGSYRGFVNSLSMTFAASLKGGLKTRIGNVISRRTIIGKFEEVK